MKLSCRVADADSFLALKFDMINNDGHGNGIGMEEGTQAEAYYIHGQHLFDMPLANGTTFYANA
jgi:hypothetical protein